VISIVVLELITVLLGLLFGTGILMLVTKILKVKGNFKTALIVNTVSSVLSFVLGLVLP